MDYEKDISIDESGLDIEWLDQPSLMFKYAKNAAQMKKELDQAAERINVIKAEIDFKVRKDPDKFGVAKITNDAIFAVVQKQEAYEEAVEEHLEAKYEYDIAKAAVSAVDQRKSALENLVKLHGQQYFAGPSVPRDISKEWEDKAKEKKTDAGVAKKLKRKRRE